MHKLLDCLREQPAIRERDDDGRLIAAGFTWLEPVEVISIPFSVLALALFLMAGGAASDAETPTGAAVALGLAAFACILICILCGWINRGIAFTREGRVSVRGGWINRLEMLWSIKEHAGIASIETVKTHRGTAVVIYTAWGGTFPVTDALSESEARFVAVQLTIALREIRESISSIRTFQQATIAGYTPTRAQAWID
jgi:hypothetical protein